MGDQLDPQPAPDVLGSFLAHLDAEVLEVGDKAIRRQLMLHVGLAKVVLDELQTYMGERGYVFQDELDSARRLPSHDARQD